MEKSKMEIPASNEKIRIVNLNKILNPEELKYAREGKIQWRTSGKDYVHTDGISENDNELILSYDKNEQWYLDGKVIHDTVEEE